MNWPQSSYSQSSSSSMFNSGGNQQQPTPSAPYMQHSLGGGGGGAGGGYTGLQQQSGYGTPGVNGSSNNMFSSGGGYQSSSNLPDSLHQQTFSTSSPQPQHHQQQLNQQQQQSGGYQQQQHQGGMQGGGGYQSFGSGNQQQYGQFGGAISQHSHNQQGQMMQNGSSFGGGTPYQQPFGTPGGGGVVNQYGSPQTGNSSMQGGNNAPSSGVGRYLPGYLTAASLSGSPRQSTSNANHDGRHSPEQSHRDAGSSFGAGSSRLFASSTSSAGTAGRDSPSRSPKQSLFSSSAYGSSRSLALTPATGSRPRRTSSNNLVRSSHDDYMEEDAPPVDTLDDFDNDAGVPYVSSPPPTQQPAASMSGAMSPSKRRDLVLPNGPTSSSSANTQNGPSSSSSSSNLYKLIVFGFSPNLQSAVLKEFASIAPLTYNSIQDPSPSPTANGVNWFTIAYDNDWAAMRALRKNGDITSDGAMIGVKLADGSRAPEGITSDLVPATSQQQQSTNLPRSTTTSALGTPATILPASQAFLAKPNSNAAAMKKSATMNKINDMGKIDASIFKQPDQNQQKQSSGVVGTLTNLIFGF